MPIGVIRILNQIYDLDECICNSSLYFNAIHNLLAYSVFFFNETILGYIQI